MKKYLVLIGDGMADQPLKELNGQTPLAKAKTTNLDWLARHGTCGWVNNVPPGMGPGSDVAAMSIFGYDPKKYYTGRGPLEAASLGVKLNQGDIAFRCNLVTVKNGKMIDFTASHVATSTAEKIFKLLNKEIGTKKIEFFPGLSYRNLLVIRQANSALGKIRTIPPHDITGQNISKYLPQGKESELLIRLMNEAEVILHKLKSPATMIWPWGQGGLPRLRSFHQEYGVRGAVITAVHLLKGLGKIVGMEIINVPGATGYLDTNYRGKAEYALRALKKNDVVFVHVEAPDEAGHEGDVKKKIKAIEDFDQKVVGTVLQGIAAAENEVRVLVLPDHPTPLKLMTHTSEAVPFVVYPALGKKRKENIQGFNEKEIKKAKIKIKQGSTLLGKIIGGKI